MYNFNYDGSKFKLRISRERYFVNEEKRTVTVTAYVEVAVPEFVVRTVDCSQLPVGFTADSAFPFGGAFGCEPVKMTATARCAPEDEFDVETGKKIAMARLEASAYMRFTNSIVNWEAAVKEFTRTLSVMTRDFVVKGAMAANHDLKYIDDISGNE